VQGAETLDFRDVHAFDTQTAILMSAGEAEKGNAKFYRTTDGGKSWEIVYQTTQKGVFFDGIDFWDKLNGIAFSDPINGKFFILKTKNGGKTWLPINPENIPKIQDNEAAFAASGTSMITVGRKNAYICTGGGEFAQIYKTENQGENWTVVKTNMSAGKTNGLFGLRFWNDHYGIAVGGDYQEVTKSVSNVLRTSDGGKTWQDAPQTNPVGLKEGVSIYKNKILIAVGPSGTCYSKDFGKSWVEIDKTPLHAISISGDGIWAVGGKGSVFRLDLKILNLI
jgi:photosystem II stability/assembly factor-like uncharacterized protein